MEKQINGIIYLPLNYYINGIKIINKYYYVNLDNLSFINKNYKTIKQHLSNTGYYMVNLCGTNNYVHRIIWQHVNGVIPNGMVIDHKDNDKHNNSIDNLQLVSSQENNLKSAKNRDYTFTKNNYSNRHYVHAIEETGEIKYFKSLYSAGKYYDVNAGIIKLISENDNFVKQANTKYGKVRFRYNSKSEYDIESNSQYVSSE